MQSIFERTSDRAITLLAAAALITVSVAFTGQPVDAATKRTTCIRAASKAVGHKINPAKYRIVLGSAKADTFRPSKRNDLFCGFAGADRVRRGVLKAKDIFIGGRGRDVVAEVRGGTFSGGAHADALGELRGGVFRGGNGPDVIGVLWFGLFEGGRGADRTLGGATFGMEDGTFLGGKGDDVVEEQSGGTFNGGVGYDSVLRLINGILISVEFCEADGGGPCP